jgi:hypothetical protein
LAEAATRERGAHADREPHDPDYKVHGVYKTRARAKMALAHVRARRPSRIRRRRNPLPNPVQSGEVFLLFLGIAFGVAGTLGYQTYVAPKLNA